MTSAERLNAAKKLSTKEIIQLKCPSDEFRTELLSLDDRQEIAKTQLNDSSGRFENIERHPQTLRVQFLASGRDYDSELKSARAAVSTAQRECSAIKQQIAELFSVEVQICDLKRRTLFAAVQEQIISPASVKLQNEFTEALQALNSLAEILDENGSSAVRRDVRQFDSDAKSLAFLTRRYGVSLSAHPQGCLGAVLDSIKQSIHASLKLFPRNKFNDVLRRVGAPELLLPNEVAAQRVVSEKAAIATAEKAFIENFAPFNFAIPKQEE